MRVPSPISVEHPSAVDGVAGDWFGHWGGFFGAQILCQSPQTQRSPVQHAEITRQGSVNVLVPASGLDLGISPLDQKTLAVQFKKPMPAGSYTLQFQHRESGASAWYDGKIDFSVAGH
jgi:hypothetical protein